MADQVRFCPGRGACFWRSCRQLLTQNGLDTGRNKGLHLLHSLLAAETPRTRYQQPGAMPFAQSRRARGGASVDAAALACASSALRPDRSGGGVAGPFLVDPFNSLQGHP